jgi:hypothetical protein
MNWVLRGEGKNKYITLGCYGVEDALVTIYISYASFGFNMGPGTNNVSVLFILLLFKAAGIKVALVDRNQEASKPGTQNQVRGQSMGLEKLVGTVLANENDALRLPFVKDWAAKTLSVLCGGAAQDVPRIWGVKPFIQGMYHPSVAPVGYGTDQTFEAKERYTFMLMAITEELGTEHGFDQPFSYIKANRMVLDAAHEASSKKNVPDMATHPDKSDWPSKAETAAYDAKLRKELGDAHPPPPPPHTSDGLRKYSVPVENQSAIGAITTVELQSLLQEQGADASWKDMYSNSEDVNGYSQVYGIVFSHNPWDADRLLENVNAIYDDLISGVPKGDGKKLTDQKVVEKYGNLLPSGMNKRTFATYFRHQASASIKRARYAQLCKERRTEVKEAKQEAAARKRAAKENAGAGKKKRKVAKPQPGPSSGVAENALEVEDLFTDGAGMVAGAGGACDFLGLADWLGQEFSS